MSESPITIQVDDRIRLLSAVLSLTTWPIQEQAYKPHGVHTHAKATRAHLAALEDHPAVLSMQELLETDLTLGAIFSYTACLDWPDLQGGGAIPAWAPQPWPDQLRDFMQAAKLNDLWARDAHLWEMAVDEADIALSTGNPLDILQRFFGPLDAKLIFQPNLCYPSSEALGFRCGETLVCVCPPRIAWGNNPPWPYDDDPAATYADALGTYAKILLQEYLDRHPREAEMAQQARLPVPNTFRARYPDWFDQFAVLFVSGLTAIFLEETFGQPEAQAYTVMAHKAHGFELLPSVVNVMEHYLGEREAGKHKSFAEYMPAFCKSLRIAEKLKKL